MSASRKYAFLRPQLDIITAQNHSSLYSSYTLSGLNPFLANSLI